MLAGLSGKAWSISVLVSGLKVVIVDHPCQLGEIIIDVPLHIHGVLIFLVVSFAHVRVCGEKPLEAIHEGHVWISVFD